MEKIKLGNYLYGFKGIESVLLGVPANFKGGVAPKGANLSRYRGSILAPPKLSLAIMLMDLLFGKEYPKEGRTLPLSVYTKEDVVYCEIDGVPTWYDSESKVLIQCGKIPHRYSMVPIILRHLLMDAEEECGDAFKKLIEEVRSTGTPDINTALLFCDSFYYGYAKDLGEITVSTTEKISEAEKAEISAAMRMGGMTQSETLKDLGFDLPKSIFDLKEVEEETEESITKDSSVSEGDDFISRCKEGEFVLDYEWSDDQKAYIQDKSFLDGFKSFKKFESLVRLVHNKASKALTQLNEDGCEIADINKYVNSMVNAMLMGKPGTGKSAAVYALSATLGMPVYTVMFSKYTDEDVAEGKTKIVDGKPQFVLTDLPKFWDKGGIFLLEEMNLADPGVTMGCFSQAFEYPYLIQRNGYEKVQRHPLSVVVLCENAGVGGLAGARPDNDALLNRFNPKYRLGDPDKDAFKEILKARTGQSDAVVSYVWTAYNKVLSALTSPDSELQDMDMKNVLSLRTCFGAIENMVAGDSPKDAIENSIIGAVAAKNDVLAEALMVEVIDTMTAPTFKLKV